MHLHGTSHLPAKLMYHLRDWQTGNHLCLFQKKTRKNPINTNDDECQHTQQKHFLIINIIADILFSWSVENGSCFVFSMRIFNVLHQFPIFFVPVLPKLNNCCFLLNFGLQSCLELHWNLALIHDVIAHHALDIAALSETWITSDKPNAVALDVAPPGYRVNHAHRGSSKDRHSGELHSYSATRLRFVWMI
jgi:hypothetical protein